VCCCYKESPLLKVVVLIKQALAVIYTTVVGVIGVPSLATISSASPFPSAFGGSGIRLKQVALITRD
jgi:hypothetical protein